MKTHFLRPLVAMLAFVGILATIPAQPAKADTTSTIIITAATVAALATAYNVERKHQLATHVVGYLSDGSTVYQDGHVTSPGGSSWYPSNSGQTISCNNNQCYTYSGNGSNPYGYNNGYNNGTGYNGNTGYNNRTVPVDNNVYNNRYNNGTNGYTNTYNNGYSNSYNNGYSNSNNNGSSTSNRRSAQERERAQNRHHRDD